MKLYKVNLIGLKELDPSETDYGTAYVVAEDPQSAYLKYLKLLDDKNMGNSSEKQLKSIEVIADERFYGGLRYLLCP